MQGYRKYTMAAGLAALFLAACYFLGAKGLEAKADPTGLGVMYGGMATGVVGIMAAFVKGNYEEHRAKAGGAV